MLLRQKLSPRNISAVYLLALIVVFFSLEIPDTFLTAQSFKSIINNGTVVGLVSLGLMVALATGVYDLSIGATLGFCGVMAGWLQGEQHVSLALALAGTMLVGVAIGSINAFMVVRVGIDSLIATLAMTSVLIGATSGLSNGQQISNLSKGFLDLAGRQLFGLSMAVYYLLALALVLWYLLEYTSLGRYLYATGGNRDAARLAGVPTDGYVAGSLIACSAVAAFAGIVQASVIGLASKDVGPQFLLPAFAAAFLGATQFRGGRFNVWGTLLAVYTLATGVKGLELWTQVFWLDEVFYGVVLALAVGIASYRGALRLPIRRKRRRPGAAVGDPSPRPIRE